MRTPLLSLLAATLAIAPVGAQQRTVAADEAEFRAEPDGTVLAAVSAGTQVAVGTTRAGWREATLEGWIWAPSVRDDGRQGYDLSVAVAGGENLRLDPNGRVLARLRQGMLLEQLERTGGWVRVRRRGWLPAETLTGAAAGGDLAERTGGEAAGKAGAAAGNAPASQTSAGGWVRVGERGGALLGAPDGDTLGRLPPGTTLEVVAREGNWARVRIAGWIWGPSLAAVSDPGGVIADVTPQALAESPAEHRGRLVEWTVEFIALDRAEGIRSDLHAGEPFILARAPGGAPGFVYIAVPEELVSEVRRLTALEDVTVLARVRTGRSAVMDAPVLELVELR